jgi:4-hydroxy-2-oxoglutarate aldolase
MNVRTRLAGIFAPIPTTFDDRGEVDRRAIAGNVARWMATPLTGLLALGSNGESALLDEAEADAVVDAVRAAVPADRVCLVGVGRESTRQTVAASRRAAAAGADAVLVRPPSFFKTQMTADALYAHFVAVADASTAPILLYNLPGVTGFALTVPLVTRLAGHPNIIGIKETSPELERLGQFAMLGGFRVLSGWAPVVFPAMAAGASGGILAVANVLPDACMALHGHARAGRADRALEVQRAITPLAQLVSSIHGVPGLKAALEMLGYHGGAVRAPLLPASKAVRDEIAAALAAAQERLASPEAGPSASVRHTAGAEAPAS